MRTQETSLAKLTTVAVFPQYYLLENLAVRADGSILVTAALHKELWYIPPADAALRPGPVLVHTFDQLASGIVPATHSRSELIPTPGRRHMVTCQLNGATVQLCALARFGKAPGRGSDGRQCPVSPIMRQVGKPLVLS